MVSSPSSPPTDRRPGRAALIFIAELQRRLDPLAPLYEQYRTGTIARTAERTRERHLDVLARSMNEITEAASDLEQVLEATVVARAFGDHDDFDDAHAAVNQIAGGFARIYGSLINVGLRLKAANVEDEWVHVYWAASEIVRLPVCQIRAFVAALEHEVTTGVAVLRSGQPHEATMSMTLKLDVDPAAMNAFTKALAAIPAALLAPFDAYFDAVNSGLHRHVIAVKEWQSLDQSLWKRTLTVGPGDVQHEILAGEVVRSALDCLDSARGLESFLTQLVIPAVPPSLTAVHQQFLAGVTEYVRDFSVALTSDASGPVIDTTPITDRFVKVGGDWVDRVLRCREELTR